MAANIYIIEGIDRLGKSTLISGIRNALGYYEVIHFSKPQRLEVYDADASAMTDDEVLAKNESYRRYQEAGFKNMMKLVCSNARIIFDRAHIGEAVYSPMYRGYDGDYVFNLELAYGLDRAEHVQLILLTEDFSIARHFVDDGESLGSIDKREEEQQRFIEAVNKSHVKNKKIICVTDQALGGFRRKQDILAEALE